jgi:hypothetical protein
VISVTRAAQPTSPTPRSAPHRTVAGIPASAQTLIPRTAPTYTCAHIIAINVIITASLLLQTFPPAPCACQKPNSLGPLRPRETQTSCVPRLRRRPIVPCRACMFSFSLPFLPRCDFPNGRVAGAWRRVWHLSGLEVGWRVLGYCFTVLWKTIQLSRVGK